MLKLLYALSYIHLHLMRFALLSLHSCSRLCSFSKTSLWFSHTTFSFQHGHFDRQPHFLVKFIKSAIPECSRTQRRPPSEYYSPSSAQQVRCWLMFLQYLLNLQCLKSKENTQIIRRRSNWRNVIDKNFLRLIENRQMDEWLVNPKLLPPWGLDLESYWN